jgi:hypothetical protein
MVDPNPARGMPPALARYWLAGKGALKIRWGFPHDFDRCVRNLTKYFPKDPRGLCNVLHTRALGAPPGKGHAITASASSGPGYEEALALIASMPMLGKNLWAGPLAPIGRLTEEPRRKRVFEHGALRHRVLPLPLDWREKTGEGHYGAVTVGRILGVMYGPNEAGLDFAWGWGDFLDDEIIPDAKKARYLMEQGVTGTSIDPGGPIVATSDPLTGIDHMMEFTIGGATLVSIPAFSAMRIYNLNGDGDWPDDDYDMVMDLEGPEEEDCGCGPKALVAAVNTSGWKGLPLAPRDAVFDNDDAVKRIQAWAQVSAQGADVEKLKRAFMWYDPRLPATNTTSYRLPFGDIINGRLTLIYHAIYAAAALLSGAHGGLPDIPEADKADLRMVISEIYPIMAEEFNDSSVRAPWDRSAQEGIQAAMTHAMEEPYGDVKYADPGYRDSKKRYPIDTPEHIRAAWAYINVPKNASEYDDDQLELIKGRIKAAAKKAGIEIAEGAAMKMNTSNTYAMTDDGYPITPPAAWFSDPELTGKTPITVDADGRLYGHLAAWGECHRDVTMRECVLAPKSKLGYAPYHLGTVLTAEGEVLKVGKIVMDTRHADIRLSYAAAALHYDNTGDEIAIVRAGEDEFGIWVAGAVVPEATPRKVAKLRRSPLSGDWRREQGSLELTAALAVNAPAFPVYAMDNEEQMALVAAGTVMFDPEEDYAGPPTGINVSLLASMVREQMDEEDERQDRAQRLADIKEDEEILAQRERARRLQNVYAMDPEAAAKAPVVTADQDWDAWLTAAEADPAAPYQIVEEGSPQDSPPLPPEVAQQQEQAPPTPVPVPAQY